MYNFRKINYNPDGRLGEWLEFSYDDKSRLIKIQKSFWDISSHHTTEFIYKDHVLWQKTHVEGWGSPNVTVYKDGVPINKKEKGWTQTRVINYQYDYYE